MTRTLEETMINGVTAVGEIRQKLTNSQRAAIRRQMARWNETVGLQSSQSVSLQRGGQRIEVVSDFDENPTRPLLITAARNAMLACGRTFDMDIEYAD